jgi:hypothetical protein
MASRRVRVAVVAAGLCAYLAAAIDTGRDTTLDWRRQASDQSKAFALNMQRDADRLRRAGTQPVVIDDQTPGFLIGARHRPWNRLERLVPAVAPSVRVIPAGAGPLQVHQNGELTPARVQGLATGARAIPDAGAVTLTGGERSRSGRPCVSAAGGPAAIGFTTDPDFAGQSLFAELTYDVLRRGPRPALITGNTYRGGRVAVPLPRRRGRLVLNLGHRLRAELPPGTAVCMRSSAVGWIQP